jgi:hypothetical protein
MIVSGCSGPSVFFSTPILDNLTSLHTKPLHLFRTSRLQFITSILLSTRYSAIVLLIKVLYTIAAHFESLENHRVLEIV